MIRKGHESANLDYKEEFDDTVGSWMELAKDAYGMANNGGGSIVIGVKDGTFEPVGVDDSFHIDSQIWADKLSKWCDGNVGIAYREHSSRVNGRMLKFPILRIEAATPSPIIPKTDVSYETNSGTKVALRQGVIYTRKNTQTVMATGPEFSKLFWSIMQRTAVKSGSTEIPLEAISLLNKKAKPDQIEETLWFNLFPVTELPDYIYAADTKCRNPSEIYSSINDRYLHVDQTSRRTPAFLLADKRIYSFAKFDENNPLSSCVERTRDPIYINEWFPNKEKQHSLIMLLNYNLKVLCRGKGFLYDGNRGRYFIRYSGRIPEVTWKPYKRTATRKLIYPRTNKDNELLYYDHFGAKMRFTILGECIYLVIEPTRVLTRDGKRPLDQNWNTKIITKNNSWYHNNDYLYDTKLLLHILAGNDREIHLGSDQAKTIVSVTPITSRANFGIVNDSHRGDDFLDRLEWKPLDYLMNYEEFEEDNPLTETPLDA